MIPGSPSIDLAAENARLTHKRRRLFSMYSAGATPAAQVIRRRLVTKASQAAIRRSSPRRDARVMLPLELRALAAPEGGWTREQIRESQLRHLGVAPQEKRTLH